MKLVETTIKEILHEMYNRYSIKKWMREVVIKSGKSYQDVAEGMYDADMEKGIDAKRDVVTNARELYSKEKEPSLFFLMDFCHFMNISLNDFKIWVFKQEDLLNINSIDSENPLDETENKTYPKRKQILDMIDKALSDYPLYIDPYEEREMKIEKMEEDELNQKLMDTFQTFSLEICNQLLICFEAYNKIFYEPEYLLFLEYFEHLNDLGKRAFTEYMEQTVKKIENTYIESDKYFDQLRKYEVKNNSEIEVVCSEYKKKLDTISYVRKQNLLEEIEYYSQITEEHLRLLQMLHSTLNKGNVYLEIYEMLNTFCNLKALVK